MLKQDIRNIKLKFYRLVGSLSVEEIMSNKPLIETIKTLNGLLVALEQ